LVILESSEAVIVAIPPPLECPISVILVMSIKEAENATTFQGVLEHYKEFNPDMLCVVRRKRGIFTKMKEKNSILKTEFYVSNFSVLVLSGLK